MCDREPLLPGSDELLPSSARPGNLRSRIQTQPFSAGPDQEVKTKPDALNKNQRCCQQRSVEQRRSPKYSIAFVAATWGFLTNIERAIILPTMWLYFQTSWGHETATNFYGSTLAAFSFSILIATPLFGYAAHANVRVKILLILANLLEVAGNIAYLLADRPWVVFLGRLIAGLGASCESPMYADLTRATTAEERTPFIIILLVSRQVGLVFGPACTLILHRLDLKIGHVSVSVYNGPGLVMACLWFFHSILILVLYPNLDKHGNVIERHQRTPSEVLDCNRTKHRRGGSKERTSQFEMHKDPISETCGFSVTRKGSEFSSYLQYHIMTLFAITFASYFCVMSLESVLSPVADRFFMWSEIEVSYVYLGASVLVLLVSAGLHLLSKCFEDRKLILWGLIILLCSYAWLTIVLYYLESLSINSGSTLMVVGVAIHVLGMPFPLAISESLYTKLIPKEDLDQAQSVLRTVINVAYLAGPFAGGSLEHRPTLVFMMMFLITFIPTLLMLFRLSSFRPPSDQQITSSDSSVSRPRSPDSHINSC